MVILATTVSSQQSLLCIADSAYDGDHAATVSQPRLLPSRALSQRPPFQLVPMPRGSLDRLKPLTVPARAPKPGQALMAVSTVGLNFRDVLNVLGMYPGDPGPPGGSHVGHSRSNALRSLTSQKNSRRCMRIVFPGTTVISQHIPAFATGSDLAGTVIKCCLSPQATSHARAGPEPLQAGDRAMGLAPGCLGSSALANAGTLVRLAPSVALAAASALPTVVLTAEAAFALAGLRQGQRLASAPVD